MASQRSTRLWPRSSIRLVLFDAFDTLLQPVAPPFQQYANEARKAGLQVQDQDVARAFKQAFKQHSHTHPNYGLTTLSSPDEWWRRVITSTFSPSLHASITRDDYDKKVADVATTLVHRFGTRAAYRLFSDVEPALSSLVASHPHLRLGVASNSDSRILAVLRDFGLGRFFNLETDHEGYWEEGGGGATLSYLERVQKPDPAFFHAAVRRNTPHAAAGGGGGSDEERRSVLYVGDQLYEDFWAARDAGLDAVWLNRRGEGMRNQPTPDHQPRRDGNADQEVLRRRTIGDLTQLLDLL